MKPLYIILTVIILTASCFGQNYAGSSFRAPSYYGFTGLMFIPTAQTVKPNSVGFGYVSKPTIGEDLTIEPYSLNVCLGFKIKNIEAAFTNTPFYASKQEFGGVATQHGIKDLDSPAPVFPSVKYNIMPMELQNHYVAMAIGFALPYGAYYAVDKFFASKLFDITLHTGVGTKLTTYHAFAGATFTFGNRVGRINRDFPLEMILEGSWGGSLKQLNQKEEAFFSIAFRYAWTSSLFISTFFRFDSQPYVYDELDDSSSTKRMGLGLSYTL